MMKQLLLSTALLCRSPVLFSPQEIAAQSHWGVTASFVPRWKPIPEIYGELWDVDFEPEGSEFRIGIVKGSDRGGDWSIMFIRNTIRTERVIDDTQFASVPPPALPSGPYSVTAKIGAGGTGEVYRALSVVQYYFIPTNVNF